MIVPQREQCNEAVAATDTVGRFLRAFHGGTQPLSTFAARLDAIGGDTVKVGSTKHECVKSGVSLSAFIGRDQQLNVLDGLLLRVTEGGGKPGKALLMRGRPRVGKSRLVEEFLSRAGVPHVYFTASTRSTGEELRLFVEEVRGSSLPGADLFEGVTPTSWDGALRLLGAALPDNGLSVVVIDELPYLTRSDPAFEGTLQKVFDRELSRRRMLFIGVGSDLAMMEALNGHGRPFYQRATEMVVPPLSPAEVAAMLKLDPANAFDAYLVTGGLPLILDEWKAGASLWEYLEDAVASPTSALLVSAERALTAEFPAELQALEVLTAIGSGERTFTNIGRAAGIAQPSLARALGILKTKRVVAAELPLSTRKSSLTRYQVADPYLRFWLAFLGPYLPEVERGRGDRVLARLRTSWPSWRGRAIEPVLREALDRVRVGTPLLGEGVVGGYWTRSNDPEIDIVIADRQPIAKHILGIGSIKWLEQAPFDGRDLARLVVQRSQLPGATDDTPLIVVARAGCEVDGVTAFGPEDLLNAWLVRPD